MKRIIMLILAGILLLSCLSFVACKDDTTEPTDTTAKEEETEPDDLSSQLDLPADLKFNGEFNILTYDSGVPEFANMDKDSPDMVDQALLERASVF